MTGDAAIYLRMSSDPDGDELGITRQREDCRALAARLDLNPVAELADNDISASGRKPRPGYQQLLGLIASGTISTVIAWHADRLHRRPAELEGYITLCEEHGVVTRTVRSGLVDLTNPDGQLTARITGAVARNEIDKMIARAKRAHLQAARNGTPRKGGPRPFGYEPDGTTLRPAEAAAIRDASRALLEGIPLTAIARDWTAAGLRPTGGGQWTGWQVRRILSRPRNAGLSAYHGEIVGQGQWTPITDEATWRAVTARLSSPARTTTPGPLPRWLGTGLFLCATCLEPVYAANGGSGHHGTPRRAYRCGNGTPAAPHVARDAARTDTYIRAVILTWFAEEHFTAAPAAPVPDPAALHAQMTVLRTRLNEAAVLHQQGIIDGQQLAEATAANRAQRAALERQITAATGTTPLAGILSADDVAAYWDAADIARRRAVVDCLMTVILHPAPRTRPAGWIPRTPYFDTDSIQIDWK